MEKFKFTLHLEITENGGVENIGAAPDKFEEIYKGSDPDYIRKIFYY